MWKLWILKLLGLLSTPIFLHAPRLYFWLYGIYKHRTEAYKLGLVSRYVKAGDTIVDVGAHIGFYSLKFAVLAGTKGSVYAFEPDKSNFQRLAKNIRGSGNVKSYQLAVGSHNGRLKLYRSNFLNVDHRTYPTPEEERPVATVEAVSLDNFFADLGGPVALIKLDVQGYEAEALAGMKSLLSKHRPVIFTEVWPWGLQRAGSSASELARYLVGYRYRLFLIKERGRSIHRLAPDTLPNRESDYFDVLALPQESVGKDNVKNEL